MIAYLFDIDGVLTDPKEKQVVEERLFTTLISLLQSGSPVGFNTGRSISWMVARVINPLLARITDKTILSRLIAIGEKGTTWSTFDEQGNILHSKDDSYAVPSSIRTSANQLVVDQYHDSMFFDETKELMVSIEMRDGFDLRQFHKRQKDLVKDLHGLFANKDERNLYTIDPTTIATDIEDIRCGKGLGAKRFLALLTEKGLAPEQYEAFGDSASDIDMSDQLHRQGKHVTMIYVGDREKLGTVHRDYPILYSEGFYKGTVAHLDNIVR